MIGTGDVRYARAFAEQDRIPFPVLVDDEARAAAAAGVESVGLARLFALPSLPATARALRAGFRIGRPGKRVNQLGATFVVVPPALRDAPALPALRRTPRRSRPDECDLRCAAPFGERSVSAPARPPLPEGLVAFVKRECPTCALVAPVLAELRQAGRAHGLQPGRSRLSAGPRARSTIDRSRCPGTTRSTRFRR